MINTTTNSTDIKNFNNYDLEFWLPKFASTWALDSIYLFIVTPVAFLGVILNFFSLFVLCQNFFYKNKIYIYFRCIALNSAIMNLVESGIFVCSTYRYFDFSNTYESNIFGIHVYIPISNTCYLFGSCLDILVNLERCSIFESKLQRLFTYQTKYVCMISFIFCVIISLPFYLFQKVVYFDAPINQNSTYRIWYWGLNSLGESLPGKILAALDYFIRDICFLAAEISINIYLIYLFKKFFKKNQVIFELNTLSSVAVNNSSKKNSSKLNQRLTLVERKTTKMVIILCFFSIFMHVFYMALTVYFYFSYDIIVNTIGAISVVVTTLKNFSNFFLLFKFNNSFRNCVKRIFINNLFL